MSIYKGSTKIASTQPPVSGAFPIGTIYPVSCSKDYTPEGALACDGTEYSSAQFSTLWTNYLRNIAGYDSSQFTTVGSPTITADGIASGFSSSNYLTTSNIDITDSSDWSIIVPVTLTGAGGVLSGFNGSLHIQMRTITSSSVSFYLVTRTSSGLTAPFGTTSQYKLNDSVLLKVSYDGTAYTLSIKGQDDDSEWLQLVSREISESLVTTNNKIILGYCTNSLTAVNGSIDLKQFSVLVDGAEVFSGGTHNLKTCTYSEYATALSTYGQCPMFAVDTTNLKFKVPTIKDGAYITQAKSDSELGKSYNESLPNITGTFQKTQIQIQTPGEATGCISSVTDLQTYGVESGGAGTTTSRVSIDASNSSSTYQNNAKVQGDNVRLRYFVQVANAEVSLSVMDWSAWASSLAGKVNTDHSNDAKPYLKTTYVNGTSGYRIWSDGYCEQWGYSPSGTQPNSVTFLKTFADTNWCVTFGDSNVGYSAEQSRIVKLYTKATTGMTCTGIFSNGTGTDFMFYWRVNGYLASSQY